MGTSGVRREEARERGPHAGELGWDDSLYEDGAPGGVGGSAEDGAGGEGGEDTGPTAEGTDRTVTANRTVTARKAGSTADSGETASGTGGKGGAGATSSTGGAGGTGGSGGAKGAKGANGAKGRRPRVRRILRWAAAVLSLLILGTAGAGYLYYRHLNGNIRSGERSNGSSGLDQPAANSAGQRPLNILLIGSDSRNKPENVELGGSRGSVGSPPLADVQMLVHVSADRKNASVVSIPRDTRVDIPECKDAETGKVYPATNTIINETLARGGPGCTLSTWEKLTGVYIDHWMTIDFSGVVKMADAIGGVEVCVKDNVWDRPLPGVPGGSGLKLTAGKHQIQGEQALQWLRTRHAFESDLGRAKAQHMYMNAMIRELKSQNVFTDTPRLTGLAEAATKSLEVSEEIGTVKKLFDLAMQLKSVPTDRLTMTTMPTAVDPQDANHLVAGGADAEHLWAMVRDDVAFDSNGDSAEDKAAAAAAAKRKKATEDAVQEPTTTPAETGVMVRNGTGGAQTPVKGRAAEIAGALAAKGYTLATADGQLTPQETTTVGYPSADLEGNAQAVAKALGIPTSSVKRSTDVSGVTVIVGADWRDGSSFPKESAPAAGGVPDTADAINGSEKDACMDVYAPYRF
ncbi:LCP family protein [Streptomyces sp. NPDC059255]|uniref:LCP family protein n=1 Tax=Streptomyces sp. NPDC059255 TaxID=3346793 RepID=UPI0036C5FC1A